MSVSLVSWSTRSPIAPPIPRSLNATDVNATSGTASDHQRDDADAGGAPGAAARRASRPAFTAKPATTRASTISSHQQPELAGHVLLDAERLGGDREGVLGQRPGGDGPGADRRQHDQRQRAQPQRDDRKPRDRADRPRRPGRPRDWVSSIARIAAPERGVGEHAAGQRRAAARAEPEQAGDRQRGRGADRVPVLEGLADAVGDLVLADRGGPDAGGERVQTAAVAASTIPLITTGVARGASRAPATAAAKTAR